MKLSTLINRNTALKVQIQDKVIQNGGGSILANQKLVTNLTSGSGSIKGASTQRVEGNGGEIEINLSNKDIKVSVGHTIKVDSNSKVENSKSCTSSEISIVNDKIIQGGYRVVSTIEERNQIECCFRKAGMVVVVVGPELDFVEYTVREDICNNFNWEVLTVIDDDVILTDDYSDFDLSRQIKTQKELNRIFLEILETVNYVGNVDKHYTHDQFIPSSIWEINHPLNKKPSVTVTDTAGSVIEGNVLINNGTKITIQFNFPFSGYAELN